MRITKINIKNKEHTYRIPVVEFNIHDDLELLKKILKQTIDSKSGNDTKKQDNDTLKYETYSIFANKLAFEAWKAYAKSDLNLSMEQPFDDHHILLSGNSIKVHVSNVRNGIEFAFDTKRGFDVIGPSKEDLANGNTVDLYLQAIVGSDIVSWGEGINKSSVNAPIKIYLAGCATIQKMLCLSSSFKTLKPEFSDSSTQFKTIPLCKASTLEDVLQNAPTNTIALSP